MTVLPNGPGSMGKSLFLWFLNVLTVTVFAGLIACGLRATEARLAAIWLFTGVTAFAGTSRHVALSPSGSGESGARRSNGCLTA